MARTRIAPPPPLEEVATTGSCAWCKVLLAHLAVGSHGICDPCATRVRAELQARGSRVAVLPFPRPALVAA